MRKIDCLVFTALILYLHEGTTIMMSGIKCYVVDCKAYLVLWVGVLILYNNIISLC
jgi:hypothetical protein